MKRQRFLSNLFDFLSSLKLAVLTLCSLAVLLAIGTIYESLYSTKVAQALIYHSFWMSAVMVLLIVNLACAAVDRFPWKKNHIGFVITHAGIITLLIGSFVTQKHGIDASMGLGIGETSRYLYMDEPEVLVYESLPNKAYDLVVRENADYVYRGPRTLNKILLAGRRKLVIKKFHPRVERTIQFFPVGNEKAPPALEFQLNNERVNVREWLSQEHGLQSSMNLGPAQVSFGAAKPKTDFSKGNQLVFYPRGKSSLGYRIVTARTRKSLEGFVEIKKPISTGWMGLEATVHRYYPHSQVEVAYNDVEEDSKQSVRALEVELDGQERWLELNSPQQIAFDDGSSYFVSYGFKKYDIGFNMTLKDFEVGHYGGTMDPMTYTSKVVVGEKGSEQVITMNEPLKHRDFTFYQASFEQDDSGKPTTSVLAVNYDPGRSTKYMGALMTVGGMISMFYFKPRYSRKKRV